MGSTKTVTKPPKEALPSSASFTGDTVEVRPPSGLPGRRRPKGDSFRARMVEMCQKLRGPPALRSPTGSRACSVSFGSGSEVVDDMDLVCTLPDRTAKTSGVGPLRASEIASVVGSYGWDIVHATGDGTSKGDDAPISEAAVLICYAEHMSAAEDALTDLARRQPEDSDPRPIIAVLLTRSRPHDEECFVEAMQAAHRLRRSGAFDVLWNPRDITELRFRVSFATMSYAALLGDVAQKFEEEQAYFNASKDNMFWQTAHRAFKDFPRLNAALPTSFQQGDSLGEYRIEERLGQGAFGAVFSLKNEATGRTDALKIIPKQRLADLRQVGSVWAEITSARQLQHPNIAAAYGASHAPCHILLRMERVGKCNLFSALKAARGAFSQQGSLDIFVQLVSGLAHCHDRGIAHRDVKPENIAVSDCATTVKIVDFGSAVSSKAPRVDVEGTFPFMAPEVLRANAEAPYVPEGCDIWSAGVVLLEMLGGLGKLNRMLKWKRGEAPSPERAQELDDYFADGSRLAQDMEAHGSEEAVLRLLARVLAVDPEQRQSTLEVLDSPALRSGPGGQVVRGAAGARGADAPAVE